MPNTESKQQKLFNNNNNTPKAINKQIRPISIVDEMKSSYINYAMSVIVARALPDARDGLKPVQRRILYSMYKLGLTASKRYKKSARTVGDVIAKYHPHGDAAVYDSMVRMAQDFNMRYPLVDGQGNFGSIDGDSPAAMRYTEAKLQKIAMTVIQDITKQTVDFIPNYDGSLLEPTILPGLLPNLIVNGIDGIAVGMATKIPPHNLSEVVDTIKMMIDKGNVWEGKFDKLGVEVDFAKIKDTDEVNQILSDTKVTTEEGELKEEIDRRKFPQFESDVTVEGLMKHIKGPDFPTGGSIYDISEVANAYATGRGRILMRAKASIREAKGGKFQIVITEIPYQVNKARLVAKIASLVKSKKIQGVGDLRDESSKDGIRIVIEIKRDGKPKTILNKLYKYTEMQKAFNANMVALVQGEPKLLTLKRLLELYITHRQEIIIRRTEFDLYKAKLRAHILEGLRIALANLDEVIKTIRRSKDAEVAKTNLMKKFKLTAIQAQAILDMQLRRLAALERMKIEQEYKDIKKIVKELENLLKSQEEILKVIKDELTEIKKKFGDERRTRVFKGGVDEFSEEDLVASEEVIVTISEKGYIKRLKENTYTLQHRGGKGKKGMTTKEDDVVAHVFSCNTHDDILFFTNKGRVFQIKVYDIPEFGRTAKGQAIINLINVDQDELITSVLTRSKQGILGEDVRQEKEEGLEKHGKQYKYLFMATKSGTVKKTKISEFEKIRQSGLIAAKLRDNDELSWVRPTTGENEVLLITKHARSIRFSEKDVRPTGRATEGVRGIKFKDKDDEVIAMDVIRRKEDHVLTVAENGFGKMSNLKQWAKQGRGGQGVFAARINKKTGELVAARILDQPDCELLIISENAQVVRIPIKDMPMRNRQTSGVRLMRVKEGDKVAAVACL